MSHAAAAAPAPPVALSPRTRLLLEGPVARTLLGLAAPNVLVMVLQAAVSTLDAVFVGWLGSAALAGVSLVFPLVMLMQTMSAGGMGGGIAAAVARALGAGRPAEARALAAHAVVIALVMASLFTTGLLLGGPVIYRAIGGTGDALEAALTYSRVVFGGAVVFWLLNTFASIVRGTGTMALPAAVMSGSAVLYLALAPALGLDCRVRHGHWDALEAADEVFLTNSLIGIWPVAALGARHWTAPGPVTRELMAQLAHPRLVGA